MLISDKTDWSIQIYLSLSRISLKKCSPVCQWVQVELLLGARDGQDATKEISLEFMSDVLVCLWVHPSGCCCFADGDALEITECRYQIFFDVYLDPSFLTSTRETKKKYRTMLLIKAPSLRGPSNCYCLMLIKRTVGASSLCSRLVTSPDAQWKITHCLQTWLKVLIT